MQAHSGLDLLVKQGFSELKGRRIGALCHPASVDSHYVHLLEHLSAENITLHALFGPEHGILGHAQDMDAVENHPIHPVWKCPIYSLYGETPESLAPTPHMLEGLEVILIDLVDIGTRYYTFIWTAVMMMQACAKTNIELWLLDRPNPLGQTREGGGIDPHLQSFVGHYDVPVRHGLSMGEMLRLVQNEQQIDVKIRTLSVDGQNQPFWQKSRSHWVMPSPNMPTLETAHVYPGQCLLEATCLSEGRGTTKPFEIFGAPWIDNVQLCKHVMEKLKSVKQDQYVALRPLSFMPTFHKYQGQLCQGAQIHVTKRDEFKPFLFTLALLHSIATLHPEHFTWRAQPYEFVNDRAAFDLLTGSENYKNTLHSWPALLDCYEERELRVGVFNERIKDIKMQ